ncbi:unnamed protein product, partial [Hapterophycus canaliculatus]
ARILPPSRHREREPHPGHQQASVQLMNARSILDRSVASFASFSRAPLSLLATKSVNSTALTPSTNINKATFAFHSRAAALYSLPLAPARRICTPRKAMSEAELKAEPKTTGASAISNNLEAVRNRVEAVAAEGDRPVPRLVAVSKTKPLEDLQEAYEAGQRIFGENYAQELIDKSPQMPDDVVWHFIGHLQSNKAKALVAGVPNLAVLETLDTVKLANKLQAACESTERERPLGVYLQIDTSGEDSKAGVYHSDLDACLSLSRHIMDNCHALELKGLMTIGAPGDMECFDRLSACRDAVAGGLGVEAQGLELSMGMSGDFEEAIRKGSTNVRVGSTIFGARNYPNKA